MYRPTLSSSSLNGTDVTNRSGENLGNIKDLMIDVNNGRVNYAVLSFGGFLGMGDKLFAIPWEAFQVDERNEKIILNVDKEKLKNAPGFDKDNWPNHAQHEYLAQVYSHYGYDPYWEDQDEDMGGTTTRTQTRTGASGSSTTRNTGTSGRSTGTDYNRSDHDNY